MSDDQMRVEDGMVVSMDYTLRADDAQGEVLDTSEGGTPLQFMQGEGQIIPGLERALYGLGIGDAKSVTVDPTDGYGEEDPDAYTEVPLSAFPADAQLEPGMSFGVRDESGQVYQAYVSEIHAETAILDFNHPLAGQTLHFDVKITDLRQATPEEQEHGHVHGDGAHDEDEEEYEEDTEDETDE
jgi:FKBP-type peptidyl-prolyl cis-trans isomerase SlyD